MGIFNRNGDFNKKLEEAANIPGAQIVDVRTPEEYREGHIPGSVNAPLGTLHQSVFEEEVPLFVYCHSGARSAQACAILQGRGYQAVNLGGILSYRGELEK